MSKTNQYRKRKVGTAPPSYPCRISAAGYVAEKLEAIILALFVTRKIIVLTPLSQ